jgi:hypothetical protein
MVDCSATFREWEQHGAVQDVGSAKRRYAFYHEAAARRDHLRHTRQEHTGDRIGGTESYSQVHSDHDEMRKLDGPSNHDQQAIRPVLTLQPRIDFVVA